LTSIISLGRLDTGEEEVIIGDDVMNINPESCFNVHFPYRRGDINLHGGIGMDK
jgi:actin-related protein 8